MTLLKRIAVLPASGIGDALIFHSAARALEAQKWRVDMFSEALSTFGCWLPTGHFFPTPPLSSLPSLFALYDAVLLQHDNSEKARLVQSASKGKPVYTIYGSHHPGKHPPLDPTFDFVCDRSLSMLQNAETALAHFFGAPPVQGLFFSPPKGLIHRKYKRRIAIHPTSRSLEKNWTASRFLLAAEMLKKEGFDPVFTVAPYERDFWPGAPLFASLEELSSFLYESGAFLGNDSGLGHIASALYLPHVILGPSQEQLALWAPGWKSGKLLSPSPWLLQGRWLRRRWKSLISTKKVVKELKLAIL